MPRFRIRTLLILTTIVAVGIFLWVRYITPNVAGVGANGSNLVIYLKPTSSLIPFHLDPNDPYALPIPGPAPASTQGEDIFTHDAYIFVPYTSIAIPLAIVLVPTTACYFLVRWWVSGRKRLKPSPPEV